MLLKPVPYEEVPIPVQSQNVSVRDQEFCPINKFKIPCVGAPLKRFVPSLGLGDPSGLAKVIRNYHPLSSVPLLTKTFLFL